MYNSIPDAISSSGTIPMAILETVLVHIAIIPKAIPNSHPETIPASYSDYADLSTLLQEGGHQQWLCEAVGDYLSSWYIAEFDLSISSHICCKIVHGRNVCNRRSKV